MKDEKLFTIKDMRNAFIQGEAFQEDYTNVEMEMTDEITELDFGEWMKSAYNIDVE